MGKINRYLIFAQFCLNFQTSLVWIRTVLFLHFFFQEFVSAVDRLFPYVTLVLGQQTWMPGIPAAVKHLSQRVVLHMKTASLQGTKKMDSLRSLVGLLDKYDVLVEEDTVNCKKDLPVYKDIVPQFAGRANTNLYVISNC